MTRTLKCRIQAKWDRVGTEVHFRPMFHYRIPILPDVTIIERLGAVGQRPDCRWNWWRFKSKHHKGWTLGQGVADSQGAAEIRVLEGWS